MGSCDPNEWVITLKVRASRERSHPMYLMSPDELKIVHSFESAILFCGFIEYKHPLRKQYNSFALQLDTAEKPLGNRKPNADEGGPPWPTTSSTASRFARGPRRWRTRTASKLLRHS